MSTPERRPISILQFTEVAEYQLNETLLNDVFKKNGTKNSDAILNAIYQHVSELNEKFLDDVLAPYDSDQRSAILRALRMHEFRPDKTASENFLLEHRIKDTAIVLESRKYEILRLEQNAVEKILLREDIKDRNVVVVSVAGSFRKGKSVLLNFFLRYMERKYGSAQVHDSAWLTNEEGFLSGFKWSGGSNRITHGILMWSEIFCATLPNGEKVAVIFLDTQGTFDNKSTMRQSATIFALSTMLSSLQIYNLSQNIQEDDLQHLQFFTEYGKLVLEETSHKPFQELLFLVRDWPYPYEACYGKEGGQEKLDKVLQIKDEQPQELQSVRKHIRSCFEKVECFLMPYPGKKMAQSEQFNGRISDIEKDFTTQLRMLVPSILSPANLVQKEINGSKVTVEGLVSCLKNYTRLFNRDTLPEPKSLLNAAADANHLSAMGAAREVYQSSMDDSCKEKTLNEKDLLEIHKTNREKAFWYFESLPKIKSEELSQSYRVRLDQEIEKIYEQIKAHNAIKLDIQTLKEVVKNVGGVALTAVSLFLLRRLPFRF